MANEITLNLDIRFQKGSSDIRLVAANALGIDVTGSKFLHNRQSIGTSAEALALGEITSAGGYFVAINRDSTNYIRLANGDPGGAGVNCVKLSPGDACAFRLDAAWTEIYATADTAACSLEYLLIEA